jgi:hypothetical protein
MGNRLRAIFNLSATMRWWCAWLVGTEASPARLFSGFRSNATAIEANTGIAVDHCTPTVIVFTDNKGKAILTPGFALLGAGIGALLPAGGWREVYRSR